MVSGILPYEIERVLEGHSEEVLVGTIEENTQHFFLKRLFDEIFAGF